MWFSAKLRRKLASHSYWKCLRTRWLNRMRWLRQIKMIILYCHVMKGSNESPECTRKIVSYFSGMERLLCVCVTLLVRHLSRRTCSVLLKHLKGFWKSKEGRKYIQIFGELPIGLSALSVHLVNNNRKKRLKSDLAAMCKYLHGEKMPVLEGLSNLAEKRSKTHWLEDEAGQIRTGDETWIPTEWEVNQETVMDVKCGCPIPCCL